MSRLKAEAVGMQKGKKAKSSLSRGEKPRDRVWNGVIKKVQYHQAILRPVGKQNNPPKGQRWWLLRRERGREGRGTAVLYYMLCKTN